MKQKLDVGGDGRGSTHVWDRGHLLSSAIRGQNGVLDVGQNATTSHPVCSGCPNLEYAFSQKRYVTVVVIRGHCGWASISQVSLCIRTFLFRVLNKLIYSIMYACSYVHTYVHKFLPVGAWWLTRKRCFGQSAAWCSVGKETIIDPLVSWSVIFNVREGCLYRFRK